MISFLLSYWYLILIIFLIIAVVTKKLIKFLIFLITAILLFVVFFEIFLAPGFHASATCIRTDNESMGETITPAEQMEAGKKRTEFICSRDKTQLDAMLRCFDQAKKKNPWGYRAYAIGISLTNRIQKSIISHNILCPDATVDVGEAAFLK